jgi:hypothetical protein
VRRLARIGLQRRAGHRARYGLRGLAESYRIPVQKRLLPPQPPS